MNIKVRFKENICWSTHIIGENNLNNCLAILQHGVKTVALQDGTTINRRYLHDGDDMQLIISDYLIRETTKGNSEFNKPYVIGVDENGVFWLYKICYSEKRNDIFLSRIKKFVYNEKMGSKKEGWRVIKLKDVKQYVDIIVSDVVLCQVRFDKEGNILRY